MTSSKTAVAALALLVCSVIMHAQTTTVVHDFTGGFSDGTVPSSGLIQDQSGNLFGSAPNEGGAGQGIIFELLYPSWQEVTVWAFSGGADGAAPVSDLVVDSLGNMYGTTVYGAANGCGTVYELSPGTNGWMETTLFTFPCGLGTTSGSPGNLVLDKSTNTIYGTVQYGGTYGGGWVYRLVNTNGVWNYSVLNSFNNHSYSKMYARGCQPWSLVLVGGVLYGTGVGCGILSQANSNGSGVVYKLAPPINGGTPWIETVLYTFDALGSGQINVHGGAPYALVSNNRGTLYGITAIGGANGFGLVYSLLKVNGVWTENLLHQFGAAGDGQTPLALTLRSANIMYGTTVGGGSSTVPCGGWNGCGTLYQLIRGAGGQWDETILHDFSNDPGMPSNPNAGHLLLSSGTIYGSTYYGGSMNLGTVYEYIP